MNFDEWLDNILVIVRDGVDENTLDEGYQAGYEDGWNRGNDEGYDHGYEAGCDAGRTDLDEALEQNALLSLVIAYVLDRYNTSSDPAPRYHIQMEDLRAVTDAFHTVNMMYDPLTHSYIVELVPTPKETEDAVDGSEA